MCVCVLVVDPFPRLPDLFLPVKSRLLYLTSHRKNEGTHINLPLTIRICTVTIIINQRRRLFTSKKWLIDQIAMDDNEEAAKKQLQLPFASKQLVGDNTLLA